MKPRTRSISPKSLISQNVDLLRLFLAMVMLATLTLVAPARGAPVLNKSLECPTPLLPAFCNRESAWTFEWLKLNHCSVTEGLPRSFGLSFLDEGNTKNLCEWKRFSQNKQ